MRIIDKLTEMIDEATEAENFKLAKELAFIQIELIDERTREWQKGYDCGYGLAMRELELKLIKPISQD
jgi:hypothetical protein